MILGYILSLLLFVEGEESCSSDNCADAPPSHEDTVSKLPGWGDEYTGTMYSGYILISERCNSSMFYWMLEKEGGSEVGATPVLLWLNGGPGASSIDGLLTEGIGPYQMNANQTFTYNEYAWTTKYNVLIMDNPVGTGYSYTDNRAACYCRTERQVAEQFYDALSDFFGLHPEYRANPFYLVGESYAGKYIPHIAKVLMEMEFPFEGVILGNGLFYPEKQYLSVPEIALNFGILNEHTYNHVMHEANRCVELIQSERFLRKAATYCEAFVDKIYNVYGGGVFVYDMRYYYDPTPEHAMISYLNRADVQSALHTTGHEWTDSDESGNVSDALQADFTISVMPQLQDLLVAGYMVILYNGQMDGSACNNVGSSKIVDLLEWSGQLVFKTIPLELWRVMDDLENAYGYLRVYKNLAFVTITNAGHMVGMTQPMKFQSFVEAAVTGRLAKKQ